VSTVDLVITASPQVQTSPGPLEFVPTYPPFSLCFCLQISAAASGVSFAMLAHLVGTGPLDSLFPPCAMGPFPPAFPLLRSLPVHPQDVAYRSQAPPSQADRSRRLFISPCPNSS